MENRIIQADNGARCISPQKFLCKTKNRTEIGERDHSNANQAKKLRIRLL